MMARSLIAVWVGLAAPQVAFARAYTYVRSTDDHELTTTIRLEPTSTGWLLTKKNAEEHGRFVLDRDGDTRQCEYSNQATQIRMSAVRKGKIIQMSGTLDGEPFKEALEIDDKPWFQDAGFSLRSFILSPAQSISFWMIHPQKLSAHQMKVTKEGKEWIEANGRKVEAVKSEIVVDEFLISALWTGYHWHRASDGVLARYQAGSVKRSSADMVVEMVSEQ